MSIGKFLQYAGLRKNPDHKTINELMGATVVCWHSDSMGSVAGVAWVGQIYDFERTIHNNNAYYTYALVNVIKNEDRQGDIRDGFCGHERCLVESGQLQYLAPKLYFWYLP